jgi:hypothetical protein
VLVGSNLLVQQKVITHLADDCKKFIPSGGEGPVPDKEVEEEEDIGFLICCDLISISL